MRDPSPRAPFDQGLFLTHFNKGKAFYDERRFEEAERELEEAYLLRPRDQKVLNLLGPRLLQAGEVEKAEEVYRKLAAESPEAHTLFYNLGLIYFKLEPPRGGGDGVPEGARARPRQPQDQLLPRAPSTSACTASRTRSTSTARPARTSWCGASRTRSRPAGRRGASRRRPATPSRPAVPQAQAGRHRGVPGPGRSRAGLRARWRSTLAPEQDPAPGERRSCSPTTPAAPQPRHGHGALPPPAAADLRRLRRCRRASRRSSATAADAPPRRPRTRPPRPRAARRDLPLPREQPDGDRLLGQGLHQAGDRSTPTAAT